MAEALAASPSIATDPLASWGLEHQDVLSRFRWREVSLDGNFVVDGLGGRTRRRVYAGRDWSRTFPDLFRPGPNDSLFEWIEVLDAVFHAQRQFTMIELGCGFARWIVTASIALRQRNDLPSTFIGVEAEPSHFRWAKRHIRDNGLDLAHVNLIQAAVGPADGVASFFTGSADAWYGQSLAEGAPPTRKWKRLQRRLLRRPSELMDTVSRVNVISLDRILDPLDHVDLIHADVQGAELAVFAAAARQVHAKVARVHIGTHSEQIEAGLRELFGRLGWRNRNDYSLGRSHETPYGQIDFRSDGVQTWLNPRFANC